MKYKFVFKFPAKCVLGRGAFANCEKYKSIMPSE